MRFIVTLALSLCIVGAAVAQAPPNVIVILADDLGYADTEIGGVTPPLAITPNLKKLANRGITFAKGYSNAPLCSATRVALHTGKYPVKTGVYDASCHVLDLNLAPRRLWDTPAQYPFTDVRGVNRLKLGHHTLAECMKDAGYVTAHFGKEHVGLPEYDMTNQGFDHVVPQTHGGGPPGGYYGWRAPSLMKVKSASTSENIDEVIATQIRAFIQEHQNEPFFINWAMFHVHGPYEADPDLLTHYQAKLANKQITDPGFNASPTYAAMVHMMDRQIGRVITKLEDLGLRNKTLVIFTSDNGGLVHKLLDGVPVTDNTPYRGGKAQTYEGGVRVPFVVSFPGRIPQGFVVDEVAETVDIYPTVTEVCGVVHEDDCVLDGQSLVPVFENEPFEHKPVFTFFPTRQNVQDLGRPGNPWQSPSVAVRDGNWKLIKYWWGSPDGQNHRYELYNLQDDAGENWDQSLFYPELVDALDDQIELYIFQNNGMVPARNPNFVPTL